jgi:dephospho-CoA kinase
VTLRVFGLTGGIGSGKSTVARRFAERGLPVIDADRLAREVVEPGTAGLREVEAAFPGVSNDRGELDRQRLGSLVFADPEQRKRLNAILHPRIRELFQQRVRELEQRGEPLACYEVPLLFEVGLAEALRPVVVVAAPEIVQIARIVARDGIDAAAAAARIAAQLPLADKVKGADHVIDTSGTLTETRARADATLDAIATTLGVPAERYPRA